jgi:23S rRNA (cytosine1962-C5)-methyltransferase
MDGAAKSIEAGTIVRFQAHDGSFLGLGSYNPHSLIAGRVFTRAALDEIDAAWFAARFKKAAERRDALVGTPYYRLIHAEADGLPGLIIDRFGPHFSVQLNSAGMDKLWPAIEAGLCEAFEVESLVLHNESSIRKLEGLDLHVRLVKGKPEGAIEVQENGIVYFADILGGQKTGWYFDQRDNHALVALFADGQSVLDLYCHAGGFGLLAARGGAKKVVGVDSSALALELAQKGAEANGFDDRCEWVKADVFDDLEARIKAKERFDIVIADPPPFVKSRKDIASGARGYRKLTRLSAEVTARGGLLFVASCSHNMELAMLTEEVAKGLHEARREGQILYTVFAAPDHPVHPHLPESAYLKGFLIRLD